MKRYSTTYSNGHTVETSIPHEAANWQNYGNGQQFFLSGKLVSATNFYAVLNDAKQAYFDKKNQTHKQVRMLHGASVANYVTKWIAR